MSINSEGFNGPTLWDPLVDVLEDDLFSCVENLSNISSMFDNPMGEVVSSLLLELPMPYPSYKECYAAISQSMSKRSKRDRICAPLLPTQSNHDEWE